MTRIQAIAIFCDDIRTEQSGKHTVIGILPDNLVVPRVPCMLPKLGMYVRAHFPSDVSAQDAHVLLTQPDGSSTQIGSFERSTIDQAAADAGQKGNPIAGVTLNAMASPFHVHEYGRVTLELEAGAERIWLGSLNIEPPEVPVVEE